MTPAEALSKVFHPLLLLPTSAFLLLNISGLSISESAYWFSFCIILSLIPTAAATWFTGERNFDVLSREKRIYSYATALASISVCLMLFSFLSAPDIVINLGAIGVLTISAFGAANHFNKVSIHTGAITATAAVYALTSPEAAALLGVASVLIGWSRVELDRHTPVQVVQGGVLGVVCGMVFLVL